jgi:Putative restriction endonuclease
MEFMEEYLELTQGAKIELLDGRLVIGDSPNHTKRLLHQLLRGWGLEAAIVLAPETLWLDALTQAFTLTRNTDLATLQAWANTIDYTPELPPYQPDEWQWQYDTWKQTWRMAMFCLDREEQLGTHTSRGVLNRLGNDALMPDNYFHRNHPHQTLYEYYFDGPADWVVEWVRSGVEDHIRVDKLHRYRAAGVPELTILDAHHQQIELLRLIDGTYQPQTPDEQGRYSISTIPGLTLLTDRLWPPAKTDFPPPFQRHLFDIAPDAPRPLRQSPRYIREGMEWHDRGDFPIHLTPSPIAFKDFIYWTPESKFEFVDGRPDIGGSEGVRGLMGMALMTFGLLEVVPLFHPRDWLQALANVRSLKAIPKEQSADWRIAESVAHFLRDQYGCDRVAVSGNLVTNGYLTRWSRLVIIAWGLPSSDLNSPYTSPHRALYQMHPDHNIALVHGDAADGDQEVKWIEQAIDLV